MNKYIGFLSNSFKEAITYRFNTIVWMILPLFSLLVQYFLWRGIFDSSGGRLYTITAEQYIAYLGIGFILTRMVGCGLDQHISNELKNGNIAVNMYKPFSYRIMMFFRHIGNKSAVVLQAIPAIIIVIIISGLSFIHPIVFLLFLASVVFAFFLHFLFSLLVGIIAFWITNVWGFMLFRAGIRYILSGEVIALSIMHQIGSEGVHIANLPISGMDMSEIKGIFNALWTIAYCFPFQSMFYTPTAIFTGMIEGYGNILFHLGLQILWIFIFVGLCELLWRKAVNRLSVNGG